MYKPKQSAPALNSYSSAHDASFPAIEPSKKCNKGTLKVWFPDGTSTSVNGVVNCCSKGKYPNEHCGTCGNQNSDYWNDWIGDHFYNQCGADNANNCYYRTSC